MLKATRGLLSIALILTTSACAAPGERPPESIRGSCSPALITAVESGDVAQIEQLARGGAQVNCIRADDEFASTPLILAIRAGHLEATKRLVVLGARVDDDRRLLSAAVEMRSPAIERLLLEARADPNLRTDEFGLLVSAFYLHDIDSAKLLLDHGADPDVRWDQSPVARLDQPPLLATTPLIAAAVEGDAAFVRLLLGAGADPALRDWGNKTALDHAMDSGHREVIALLSEASRRSATRGTKPNTGRSHRIGRQ